MKASLLFPAVFSPQRNNTEIKHAVLIQVLTVKFFLKQSRILVLDILLTRFFSSLSFQLSYYRAVLLLKNVAY